MSKFKWMSLTTGELETNILAVTANVFSCLIHYHFLNIRWKYNRKGW